MAQFKNILLEIRGQTFDVNLENNNLETVGKLPGVHPFLSHLYLANNKLRRFPETFFNDLLNLKQVTLSGNPWNCDCSALKFKRWLISNHDIIRDFHNVRCGNNGNSNLDGRVVWTLSDYEMCPSTYFKPIIYISICFTIFLLFCIITKVMLDKFQLNIKVFLYSRGFSFVKNKDNNPDKRFDTFICFCEKDEDFVENEIISVVKKEDPNFSFCTPNRDFMPGELIFDNIQLAMKNSKATVFVLSKNFFESERWLNGLKMALIQVATYKMQNMIVINVDDAAKELSLPMQACLNGATYLTWGDTSFWDNFLFLLPTSTDCKNNKQNTAEEIV